MPGNTLPRISRGPRGGRLSEDPKALTTGSRTSHDEWCRARRWHERCPSAPHSRMLPNKSGGPSPSRMCACDGGRAAWYVVRRNYSADIKRFAPRRECGCKKFSGICSRCSRFPASGISGRPLSLCLPLRAKKTAALPPRECVLVTGEGPLVMLSADVTLPTSRLSPQNRAWSTQKS